MRLGHWHSYHLWVFGFRAEFLVVTQNNSAVTLALATWRSFPWKKSSCELDVHPRFTFVVYSLNLQGFLFVQLLGGIVGAELVYAIDIVEGGRHI